jgi:hypothetical protein
LLLINQNGNESIYFLEIAAEAVAHGKMYKGDTGNASREHSVAVSSYSRDLFRKAQFDGGAEHQQSGVFPAGEAHLFNLLQTGI